MMLQWRDTAPLNLACIFLTPKNTKMFVRASHVTYKSWGQTRTRDAKSCERALSVILVHSRRSTLMRSRRFSCALKEFRNVQIFNTFDKIRVQTPLRVWTLIHSCSRSASNSHALSSILVRSQRVWTIRHSRSFLGLDLRIRAHLRWHILYRFEILQSPLTE